LSSTTSRAWPARVILIVLLTALAHLPAAAASPEDLDLKARTFYAQGEYKAALDIYASLYAQTLHPTYLRNIGRCYQNMGEPERAITSFKEYLRKAEGLDAKSRAEVEGYIKEMEELKRSRAKEAARPEPSSEPAPRETRPAPSLEAPRPSESQDESNLAISKQPSPSPEEAGAPIYTRWWFWGGVGLIVAGAVVGAIVLSQPSAGPAAPTSSTDLGTMSWHPN
jgi:hypothetical protein